jgi:hypothetical protein
MCLRIQRTVGIVNWWRGLLMTVAAKVVPLRELGHLGEVEENEGESMRKGGSRYESNGAYSTVEQIASFPTFKDQLKQDQIARIEYDEVVVKVAGAE